MPRHRVLNVSGVTAPLHRVLKVAGAGDAITGPRHRVLKLSGVGDAVAPPRHRVLKVAGAGTTSVTLNPFTNLTDVEPETVLSITATMSDGSAADAYTWRQISGPAVALMGTGATRVFRAPSQLNGSLAPVASSVVLGVTATVDGVTSPERTITVGVLPQLRWYRSAGQWLPMRPVVEFAGA